MIDLKPYLESSPDDPELLAAYVQASIRAAIRPEEIEPYSRRWYERNDTRAEAAATHLQILKQLHRGDSELLPVLERLASLTPDDAATRMELASAYFSTSRYDDAIREFQLLRGSRRIPEAQAVVAIARAEFARGQFSSAARELDVILAQGSDNPDAVLLRGLVHQQLQEDDRAIEFLKKTQPRDIRERILVLNHLGQSLSRVGRTDESRQAFDQLSRLQEATHHVGDADQRPTDLAFQLRGAESLLKADFPREAASLLNKALDRVGPDRALYRLLAECYDKLGDREKAREARAAFESLR